MDIFTDHLSGTRPAFTVPRPRQGDGAVTHGAVTQHLTYPEPGTAVLTVTGDVDAATAPRLAEMLQSRLCSQLRRMVVDLSGVGFLGVAGVRTLMMAELRAWSAEAEMVLVSGSNREVTRVLSATAALHQLRFHADSAASALVGGGECWVRG